MSGSRKNRTIVILENLQPSSDIGGVVFARLLVQFEIRTEESGAQFGSGADMSRARLFRVHRRPLTGSTAGITPVVEARVEWRKK